MNFQFLLKDSRYNNYKKIVSLFFLLAAFLFAFTGFQATAVSLKIVLFVAASVLTAYAVYHWKYKQKREKSFIAAYLIIIAIWLAVVPVWIFVLLFLLLLIIQLRIEKNNTIAISKEGIIIDSFLKQDYSWNDLNNLILKDGLLTLDFRNNKILQVEPDWNKTVINGIPVEAAMTADTATKEYWLTEKEFNDFCRQQLNK